MERLREIERLVAEYRSRGDETRREFCARRGLTSSWLDYYLRRYGKAGEVRMAKVEVVAAPVEARFALLLSNGRRVECGADGLEALVRVGERA